MTAISCLTANLVAGAARVMGEALCDLPCEENLFNVLRLEVIVSHFSVCMGTYLVTLCANSLPYALKSAHPPLPFPIEDP